MEIFIGKFLRAQGFNFRDIFRISHNKNFLDFISSYKFFNFSFQNRFSEIFKKNLIERGAMREEIPAQRRRAEMGFCIENSKEKVYVSYEIYY